LPIDLCLVSPETVVSNVTVEEDAGSDHRPIVVELWVPARH
jgi:endonuclease/exonuclease/phosphatase (EEP) superfamily protein YafD